MRRRREGRINVKDKRTEKGGEEKMVSDEGE